MSVGVNIEKELQILREICIDNESDNDMSNKSALEGESPPPPMSAALESAEMECIEEYIDLERYIQEKCENRIKILDRSKFPQIKRPIIIGFNHFREKCYSHTKWLDRFYEVSLKYGDRIELIVADQIDMDLIYPQTNTIDYFCSIVRPEDEGLGVYAIDEKKRVYEYFDAYKTVENLMELCEQLLNGSLYKTQTIPEENDDGLMVKLCVLQNYEELVTASIKDILLIVGMDDYDPAAADYEPDYEKIAKILQDSNVAIVYINGFENYVPFEFFANSYPTLLFIPHNDKQNFLHYDRGPRDTENVLEFIRENLGGQGALLRHQKLRDLQFKPFSWPKDSEITFPYLQEYIIEHFPKSLIVLDRQTFNATKEASIIYFMDFKGNGVKYYTETLQRIHQVSQSKYYYGVKYLIADLQDIDIMFPKWYNAAIGDQPVNETSATQVFAIDRLKRFYKITEEFKSSSALFYYAFKLSHNEVFRSQAWTTINNKTSEMVKTCMGHNLMRNIAKSNTHVFLTIYSGSYKKESTEILNILKDIAQEARHIYVKIFKIDAKLNYIPLEYTYGTYPVHFLIPSRNRDERTIRYISVNRTKEDIMEFIRNNVQIS